MQLRRLLKALLASALLALGFGITGPVAYVQFADLERETGFKWLTLLRDVLQPRVAPADSLVVSIDRATFEAFGHGSFEALPRELYACLVEVLRERGAALIVLDVAFTANGDAGPPLHSARAAELDCPQTARGVREGRGGTDLLAEQMRLADNTLALRFQEHTRASTAALDIERIEEKPLDPVLRDAARDSAPFPMPIDGGLFSLYEVHREQPILPALAAAHFVARRDRNAAIGSVPGIDGRATYLINYYGPPGMQCSVSMLELLTNRPQPRSPGCPEHIVLDGRAVFVGAGWSFISTPTRLDKFRTPYSGYARDAMSGVEVGVTIFDNIRTGAVLSELAPRTIGVLLLALGAAAGFVFVLLPLGYALLTLAAITASYVGVAYWFFAHEDILFPLAIPLVAQITLILVVGLLLHYRRMRRLKGALQSSYDDFVPPSVADVITDAPHVAHTRQIYGTCMTTDIAGYTTIAERIDSQLLARRTNAYFERLGQCIRAEGGELLEIVGDGSTSLWQGDSPAARTRACAGARRCAAEATRFTLEYPDTPFPTRIGLHAGTLSVGSVGGAGRLTAGLVGDIANTASRIEGLNKYLRTHVLASAEAMRGVTQINARRVGWFVLKGKSEVLEIFELPTADPPGDDVLSVWHRALDCFARHDWPAASAAFRRVLDLCPRDGPATFFAERCEELAQAGIADPDSHIVRIDGK